MFAPGVLVCVLVWEVTALYRRLFEAHVSLRQTSMHDALTGIYNRTYFNEQIPKMLGAARRGRAPLSLVMIDVDHFKRYNDAYGHLKGDGCLAAVAEALAGVILLIAERAREAVLYLRIEAPTPSRFVTVSAGCATTAPGAPTTLEALVEAADAALYQAKAAGRNLVVPAEEVCAVRMA
jgi:PleD family two-component response regulator